MRLISFEELVKVTGYTTPADVRRHLKALNIPHNTGKYGRPYTWSGAFDPNQQTINKPSTKQQIKI